jgi:CTP synthase
VGWVGLGGVSSSEPIRYSYKSALYSSISLCSSTRTVGTIASKLYGGVESVSERHRHRYEVNPSLVSSLEEKGLLFSGKDTTAQRMEIVELDAAQHPYFLAVQFHPEFKSRPQRPSPVFLGFLQALKAAKK